MGDPAVNRVAPHLHGGLVPWTSDGGPFHWFSPGGAVKGPSVVNWLPDDKGTLTDDYWYPNNQSARMMWYHDHAVGITRLNAVRRPGDRLPPDGRAEANLMDRLRITADRQIPLVVQDKVFNPDGSLWYPSTYDTEFFDLEPGLPLPAPSLVPEFWGDTMLVNGTAYPFLEVKKGVYRFRILNACNTRFLNLSLFFAAGCVPVQRGAGRERIGPAMRVIGTEGGFLDGRLRRKAASYGATTDRAGPGARARRARDILIDFSAVPAGSRLILHNDAPVPFPGGTPLADFYPGNRELAVPPAPGFSPNTRTLLQFRVVAEQPRRPLRRNLEPVTAPAAPAVPTARRRATWRSRETVDQVRSPRAEPRNARRALAALTDPPTEIVQAGTVEIWRLFNGTADTHPIHFHYFNVRVLSRQAFTTSCGRTAAADRQSGGSGAAREGMEGDRQVKRRRVSHRCWWTFPRRRTRAEGRRDTSEPADGRSTEYVWHCHILEHEEHDMMRPLIVKE